MKKTRKPPRSPSQKKLREVFGDLPLTDATEPLTIFPTEEDFKQAVPLDPHNCGFARCAERVAQSRYALVFGGATYFDHVGSDGVRRIYRYYNAKVTRRVIRAFDRGEKIDVSRPFVFLPPSKSNTLRAVRARAKRLRASPRSQVILKEWTSRKRMLQAEADQANLAERLERLAGRKSPASPQVTEATEQLRALKSRLRCLRDDFHAAQKAANEVRLNPYRESRTVAKSNKLRIRNGSGFMAMARSALAESKTQ